MVYYWVYHVNKHIHDDNDDDDDDDDDDETYRYVNQWFKPQILVALLEDIHGTHRQPKSLALKAANTSLLCCDNFFPRRLRTISREKWQETMVSIWGEPRAKYAFSNPGKVRVLLQLQMVIDSTIFNVKSECVFFLRGFSLDTAISGFNASIVGFAYRIPHSSAYTISLHLFGWSISSSAPNLWWNEWKIQQNLREGAS